MKLNEKTLQRLEILLDDASLDYEKFIMISDECEGWQELRLKLVAIYDARQIIQGLLANPKAIELLNEGI